VRILCAALWLLACPSLASGITPIDAARCAAMTSHHVLSASAPIGCERLSLVTFSYVDFEGRPHDDGQIIVLDAVAPRVLRIFEGLQARRFPIAKAVPVEAYEGDDDASMADNNTTSFNDRPIAGTSRPSLHAYGAAIDLDPVQNPYLTFKGAAVTVAPSAGAAYLNRRQQRPQKPERAGLAEGVVALFAQNGFSRWGGDWDDPIDYQHFDIGRPLAEILAALPPDAARTRFEAEITSAETKTPAKSP